MTALDKEKKQMTILGYVQRVLGAVGILKQFLFTGVFALFTKPPLAAAVLLVAGPFIFATAAVLEVIEYALSATEAALIKDESPQQRRERRGDLVLGFARTTLITAAVVGSIVFAPIFTTALLGLAGGLTPLIFTVAMGAMAITGFGDALHQLYLSTKTNDPAKKSELRQAAKSKAINAFVTAITAVAVGLLMLNPITAPAIVVVAAVTATVYVAHLAYTHRATIGHFFKGVRRSLAALFMPENTQERQQSEPLLRPAAGRPRFSEAATMGSVNQPSQRGPAALVEKDGRGKKVDHSVASNLFTLMSHQPGESEAVKCFNDTALRVGAPAP